MNNGEWRDSILRLITRMPAGTLFTSDDVRVQAEGRGIENPPHPNAWGSIFRQLRKDKLAVKTGRYLPSEIPSNHGRVSAEWRKT